MFRKMPVILLAIIIIASLSDPFIPVLYKSIFYGVSLTLKSLIVFVLPFLIFGLLFKTSVQLAKKASKMVLIILVAISASNFISTMLSFIVGKVAFQLNLSMTFPDESISLAPAWQFVIPKLIGNDTAMFSGLLLGIIFGRWRPALAEQIAFRLDKVVHLCLSGFLLVIPFFIWGFVIKLNHDQVMGHILHNYALVFSLVAAAVFSYIALVYFIANRFQIRPFLESIKNMLPATIAGFGSMSSAAVMPLTILGAEKNARNPEVPKYMIPATVNNHLVGDCFAIPIFAFAVMHNFGMAEPSFVSYLIFAAYFVLAKYSVAAVPGGGVLVMLPILESNLGLDPQMLSLVTALYILFDPIITCANVLGNGAFSMVMDRVQSFGENPEVRSIEGSPELALEKVKID